MVRVPKVDLGVDPSLAGSVKQVGNERKRVVVLLRNPIKRSEVDAKPKTPVFLLREDNWSTVRRSGLADESCGKVLVDEFPKSV